jgi:endopeptidase La
MLFYFAYINYKEVMEKLTVKDFLLFHLNVKYIERSQVIARLIDHVINLNVYYILSNSDKNKYLKELNDLIKFLNMTYNSKLKLIRREDDDNNNSGSDTDNDSDKSDDDEVSHVFNNDEKLDCNINLPLTKVIKLSDVCSDINKDAIFTALSNTIGIGHTDILNMLCKKYFNFDKIDVKIKELMLATGSNNINDVFIILLKCPLVKLIELNKIIDVGYVSTLIKTFRPTSCVLKTMTNVSKKIKDSITLIQLDTSKEEHCHFEMLLNNYYELSVSIVSGTTLKNITFAGTFVKDSLNADIRTSQLCNQFVHAKKKLLIEMYDSDVANTKQKKKKTGTIPEYFKEMYIKNITLGELLAFTPEIFIQKIYSDYVIYQQYSISSNFKVLFADFIKSNLKTKFNIIRCLLMGPSTSTKNAGLLFSLTKENKSGSQIVSDIIYDNLSFQSQLKLHKSGTIIKKEIEKFNNLDVDDIDLKNQIALNSNIPPKVKKLAMQKLEEMKSGNSEYYKQMQYVKVIAEYPWIGENDDDIFMAYGANEDKWKEIMEKTHSKLDEIVYGHKECKDSIVELLGKWFSNPKSLGKAIGLEGPPGVGKTLLAKGLGNALGIPFSQINLGGMEDGSILTGHSITYSGAVPGLIVIKMTEGGKSRCIILFDEVDKSCYRHGRNEISDILIHVIDPNSNSEFNDKFFQDVRFPINKVLFVFSFNDRDKVDKILLDRMEVITVKAYTMEDKLLIAKNFLMKEVLEDVGLTQHNISFNDEELSYLIEHFTYEAGVRGLKRMLEKVVLKLNKERIYKTGIFEGDKMHDKIIITKEMIEKYLAKPTISIKRIHTTPEVGIVNGLYATTTGTGGIIPILVYKHHTGKHGKFTLKLTGKQGTVMKESVLFSFTMASNLIKKKYCDKFFHHYPSGLHIHTPDGATPKDGPSAGGAFTLAFISKILNMKIKNKVAMTGEIELNGNITAIGGLEYKLDGAKRAGVELVFVPKENEQDLEKIKKTNKSLICDKFRCILVEHITEIADYALIDPSHALYVKLMKNKNADVTYEKIFNHEKYMGSNAAPLTPLKHKPKKNISSKKIFDDDIDNIDNTSSDSDKNDNNDDNSNCSSMCNSSTDESNMDK